MQSLDRKTNRHDRVEIHLWMNFKVSSEKVLKIQFDLQFKTLELSIESD